MLIDFIITVESFQHFLKKIDYFFQIIHISHILIKF